MDDPFLFRARTPLRKEIVFIVHPLAGVAIESRYSDTGDRVGEAATVDAPERNGLLAARSVLGTRATSTAWAVPAAFLAHLIDS